jgi:DNA repair protein RAD51
MIETGLKKLDQLLGGGIKEGLITDISGQNSTGKTQLVFQICINAIKNGKEILFQDTTGEFRPERLVEMLNMRKLDPILLDKIKVGRITNSIQQLEYLSKTTNKNFSLIVIDNATDLFSFEY